MTTKLIPVVALVPEATLTGLNLATVAHGEPDPALAEILESNGWTIEAIIAGSFITFSLRDAGIIS